MAKISFNLFVYPFSPSPTMCQHYACVRSMCHSRALAAPSAGASPEPQVPEVLVRFSCWGACLGAGQQGWHMARGETSGCEGSSCPQHKEAELYLLTSFISSPDDSSGSNSKGCQKHSIYRTQSSLNGCKYNPDTMYIYSYAIRFHLAMLMHEQIRFFQLLSQKLQT